MLWKNGTLPLSLLRWLHCKLNHINFIGSLCSSITYFSTCKLCYGHFSIIYLPFLWLQEHHLCNSKPRPVKVKAHFLVVKPLDLRIIHNFGNETFQRDTMIPKVQDSIENSIFYNYNLPTLLLQFHQHFTSLYMSRMTPVAPRLKCNSGCNNNSNSNSKP